MEEEPYWRFVHRHKRSTLKRSIERHRRSINNHVSFRQAEIDEPTLFEGTVTSITDGSIEATFNWVPAGDYILQVNINSIKRE